MSQQEQALLSIIRNNETAVATLISRRYNRGQLFPQLNNRAYELVEEFLRRQEGLYGPLLRGAKLTSLFLVTLYNHRGRVPLDEEIAQVQNILLLIDSVFRHGLKVKRTFLGYTKSYWDMIQEFYLLPVTRTLTPRTNSPNFNGRDSPQLEVNSREVLDQERKEFNLLVSNYKTIGASFGIGWLRFCLNRGIFFKRFSSLTSNTNFIREWYEPYAFIAQDQAQLFGGLLTTLETVTFNFTFEEAQVQALYDRFERVVPEKDLGSWLEDIIVDLEDALDSAEESKRENAILITSEKSPSPPPPPPESIPLPGTSPVDDIPEIRVQTVTDSDMNSEHSDETNSILSEQSKLSSVGSSSVSDDPTERITTQLQEEISLLKKANTSLLEELGKHQVTCSHQATEITQLTTKLTKLQKELVTERLSREENELRFRELGSQLAHVLGEVSSKQAQITQLQSDLSASRKQSQSLQDELYDSHQLIRHSEASVTKLQEALEAERLARQQLSTQLQDKSQLLEILAHEMAQSKLSYTELTLDRQMESSRRQNIHAWVDDSLITQCAGCQVTFSLIVRKHHCRRDGKVYCATCTPHKVILPSSPHPVRVCHECYNYLTTSNPPR